MFDRRKCHEGEYMKTVFEHVLNELCLILEQTKPGLDRSPDGKWTA